MLASHKEKDNEVCSSGNFIKKECPGNRGHMVTLPLNPKLSPNRHKSTDPFPHTPQAQTSPDSAQLLLGLAGWLATGVGV